MSEGYDDAQHQELRDAGRLVAPPPDREYDVELERGEFVTLREPEASNVALAAELAWAEATLERARATPPIDENPAKVASWKDYVARVEKIRDAIAARQQEAGGEVISLARWRELNPDPREVGE